MTSCGFGEGCDLARSEVLQNWVRDCSSCDVCNNWHKQVGVSCLFSEVMPMFGGRFAESRHSSECVLEPAQQLVTERGSTRASAQ